MKLITVLPGQTLFDVIIMACGTMEGSMAFTRANGLSISDVVAVGTELVRPEVIATDNVVMKYLSGNKILIGTDEVKFIPGGFVAESSEAVFISEDGAIFGLE